MSGMSAWNIIEIKLSLMFQNREMWDSLVKFILSRWREDTKKSCRVSWRVTEKCLIHSWLLHAHEWTSSRPHSIHVDVRLTSLDCLDKVYMRFHRFLGSKIWAFVRANHGNDQHRSIYKKYFFNETQHSTHSRIAKLPQSRLRLVPWLGHLTTRIVELDRREHLLLHRELDFLTENERQNSAKQCCHEDEEHQNRILQKWERRQKRSDDEINEKKIATPVWCCTFPHEYSSNVTQ